MTPRAIIAALLVSAALACTDNTTGYYGTIVPKHGPDEIDCTTGEHEDGSGIAPRH